jgi:FSR family fosmidomycin resistance protein-like MFS transporter
MNSTSEQPAATSVQQTVFPILFAVCFGHFLNDMIQAILPSVYPMLKTNYQLSFGQVGLITFAFQVTASILQPFVGNYTDKHAKPYSFVGGMLFSLCGIILLAYATGFLSILIAACFIGIGSSIFHPEASRVAYYASGGKRGLAQAIFQLGGNAGAAFGPLFVLLIVVPFGQVNIQWFVVSAILAIVVLSYVGRWYKEYLSHQSFKKNAYNEVPPGLSQRRIVLSIIILLVLIFSKFFYTASINNFYTFYLIERFKVPVEDSQFYLFLFMGSVTVGTLAGGPLGDKFGRKVIIWFSILGAAPFALMLPYADLTWTCVLICTAGAILASAFSSILVYAQELLPGKIGMVSGLFYGFAFGMGAVGSAVLGHVVDVTSLEFVFKICSFLPLLGIITVFLPNIRRRHTA